MKQTPITLTGLARLLNVHVSTVSRVLNGSDEDAKTAASDDTVRRIRELAKQLNYRPNQHAIGLRTQKTKALGVLTPRLSDIVIATIYEGIDEAAVDLRYQAFVSNTRDIPARQRELGEAALDRRVEGLIFTDARLDEPGFIDEIAKRGVPMVLVSRRLGTHCSVTCDDELGGALAAEHLIGLGHRHIAVLAGEPYASTGVDRSAGFIARSRELGVKVNPTSVIHSPFHAHAGRAAAEQLLQRRPLPTAIFAVNDFLAIGLLGVMRDLGLRTGQDIAVVGYNDTAIAGELPIGLTTIRSPMHQIGYRGAELLIDRIGGKQIESEKLVPELIVRASTAGAIVCARCDDPTPE